MSTRVKSAIALMVFVFFVGFQGYAAWRAAPVLAPQVIAYNQAHPLNWVDVGLGALAGVLTTAIFLAALSAYESWRFEKRLGGGNDPQGSGGGGQKQVRLPMSWKVVDISTWQPPKGDRMHRGFATT